MAEQRRRMTYEEQRALREQQAGRAAGGQTANGAEQAPTSATQTRRTEGAMRRQSTRQTTQRRSTRSSQRPSGRTTTRHQQTTRQASTRQSSETGQQAQSRPTRQGSTARQGNAAARTQRIPVLKIAIAIVLVVAVVIIVRMCSAATPISVTVNGTSYELRGAKTVQTAIKTSGLPVNPGDFISLKGNILEKSKGDPFLATVNGVETADPDYGLRDGDTLTITDGKDIVEDYDSEESAIPFGSSITGVGAVHKFEAGEEGVLETRTGKVSGETVEKTKTSPTDATCSQYNLNTSANKVIAFTFDDGPSSDYTAAILDILAENDAKATFFCIGTEVESYPELVKRESDEGHQVCTHSYDHADPVGGTDIGLMNAAGQVDEIVHGMKTITDVLGGEASRVVRMPGGNLSEEMVMNLQPYIDYDIGWNIDTEDWTLPGAESIYQSMIAVQPGEIILCHDGGGDRSETVEALRRALPYLKSKGFSFVTMDEILQYPAKS